MHLAGCTSQEETIDVEEFCKDWSNFESDKNDNNSLDEPLPLELERLSTYIAVNPALCPGRKSLSLSGSRLQQHRIPY